MKFKKGDKVRFLDEAGGGIVSLILNNGWLRILTDEGLEMDMRANELVHADPEKLSGPYETVNEEKKLHLVIAEQREPDADENEKGSGITDGIYLLFVPENENDLTVSDICISLVNNTDYDLLYCYSYKYEKDFVAFCTGTMEEGSISQLDTMLRKRMEEYSTVKLDIIFYKNMPYEALEPISEIIKLKTVKFFKPNSYSKNPFSEKVSHLEEICSFPSSEKINEPDVFFQKKVAEFMLRKKEQGKNISRSHSFYEKQLEREVDLHLEEILDNVSGMSNAEKLNYQLNYFKRELDAAIAGNIKKIIFIHGVGNGRLKAEICAVLETYNDLRFHDASFRKYGFGATEVIVR
jgi:hypothetical protein